MHMQHMHNMIIDILDYYDWPIRLPMISPLSCTVLSPLPLDHAERPGPPLHSHRVPPAPLQAMHSDRNGTGSCDTAWVAGHAPWVGPAVMCEEIAAQRIFSCTCTADGRVQQHLLPRDLPLPETTTSPFLIYVRMHVASLVPHSDTSVYVRLAAAMYRCSPTQVTTPVKLPYTSTYTCSCKSYWSSHWRWWTTTAIY